ncbi:hypothetical protein JW979_11385 [bacterium]|nr:hypothetical protein [candidate division CSSED10-310 bacterium]
MNSVHIYTYLALTNYASLLSPYDTTQGRVKSEANRIKDELLSFDMEAEDIEAEISASPLKNDIFNNKFTPRRDDQQPLKPFVIYLRGITGLLFPLIDRLPLPPVIKEYIKKLFRGDFYRFQPFKRREVRC